MGDVLRRIWDALSDPTDYEAEHRKLCQERDRDPHCTASMTAEPTLAGIQSGFPKRD